MPDAEFLRWLYLGVLALLVYFLRQTFESVRKTRHDIANIRLVLVILASELEQVTGKKVDLPASLMGGD